MGILSFLFGCQKKQSEAKQIVTSNGVQLEEISSRMDEKEGWADVYLKIVSEVETDTSRIYIAKGLHKGVQVGLQIEIKSNIGAGIVDGSIDGASGFAKNGVCLQSIGEESDNFIQAMGELYKVRGANSFTKQPMSLTVFSLNAKAVDLNEKDYYKLKLFFEDADEELYAELFLNINTQIKEIELHEKDEAYRKPLIKFWTR